MTIPAIAPPDSCAPVDADDALVDAAAGAPVVADCVLALVDVTCFTCVSLRFGESIIFHTYPEGWVDTRNLDSQLPFGTRPWDGHMLGRWYLRQPTDPWP